MRFSVCRFRPLSRFVARILIAALALVVLAGPGWPRSGPPSSIPPSPCASLRPPGRPGLWASTSTTSSTTTPTGRGPDPWPRPCGSWGPGPCAIPAGPSPTSPCGVNRPMRGPGPAWPGWDPGNGPRTTPGCFACPRGASSPIPWISTSSWGCAGPQGPCRCWSWPMTRPTARPRPGGRSPAVRTLWPRPWPGCATPIWRNATA